jgi:pimeloyl-ACP methyl ester carboxylesterase
MTPPPLRRRLVVPGASVDRWVPTGLSSGVPLVLVHGFAKLGKNEPEVRRAASLLARAGFDVAVPTIPGLTAGRLRPIDAEPVVAALEARPGPAVLLAVSVGAGPAFLAAADPRARGRVRTLVSVDGYASAVELVRFLLTGEYAFGEARGRTVRAPEVVQAFVTANADLVDASARRLLAAREPAEAEAAVQDLSPPLRALLDALSPVRVAPDVTARLVLIHGGSDHGIPYTESLRLAAARPEGTSVVLLGRPGDAEGARSGWWGLSDGFRLWGVLYRLLSDRG